LLHNSPRITAAGSKATHGWGANNVLRANASARMSEPPI
jgi:hypothetical protein